MFLLDTNVLSELRKGRRGNAGVLRWNRSVALELCFVSVLTVLEIEKGALALRDRDPTQSQALMQWLENGVLPSFQTRILPVDLAVSRRCAEMQSRRTRPYVDTLLAATAAVHGFSVVTGNVRDFGDTGVRVVNPFE